MADTVHIVVEKGPDKGLKISVPPEGARLGRSSRNDITLTDPLLSRHHCRFFFKTGNGLCVTDLGSANGTLVNDEEITEQQLSVGDKIHVGDSLITVVKADTPSAAREPAGDSSAAAPIVSMGETQPLDTAAPTPVSLADTDKDPSQQVDLGLNREAKSSTRKAVIPNRKILYIALAAVTLLAVLAWVYKLSKGTDSPETNITPVRSIRSGNENLALDIEYEKVKATAENIFRYHLRLKNNDTLIVKIDDLLNDRHVRKVKNIDPTLLRELAEALKATDFFTLQSEYSGIQPGILDQWDITISIGRDTHRSKVINRIPPDSFEKVTEIVENFGKNELGLWAIQFSAEKLTEMARDALQDGKKLFDTRDVAYGNLAEAIKKLSEAEWYLETVEPKPDFYAEILTLLKDCKFERHSRYEDANFRAARAIKMRQWDEAARELRIIREMIPDRSDPRNQDATKSLLDVERRIKTGP